MMHARLLVAALLLVGLSGCDQNKTADLSPSPSLPEYGRALGPGESALRLVDNPALMPRLDVAFANRDAFLLDAIDESLLWFSAPSSRSYFPFEGITHEQARASVQAMRDLLASGAPNAELESEFRRLFDVYESVGYNGRGTVLFTGYYAGEFRASEVRTDRFRYPIYRRPDDLLTDARTGHPLGRRLADGSSGPYPTRREIEEQGLLAGTELYWLEDPLSVYIAQVNGSAKLRMPDGSLRYVGYAGKTDRPYASLGEAMIKDGIATRDELSLHFIKKLFHRQPERVQQLMYENQCYVFFTEYPGDNWPAGSLGVKVTQETSLATDKKIYPRGGLVLADTTAVTFTSGRRPFTRFMLDQDTGGAIKAPGRADIYMGDGNSAEILAGGQYAEGRLFYFFLKPQHVAEYAVEDSPTRAAAATADY